MAGAADDRVQAGDLLIAGGLAFLAGATDVYGLGLLRGLFVSFMSGNTTLLGAALGDGDWGRALKIAEVVGLFVAGAAVGGALDLTVGRQHATIVSCLVTSLLFLSLAAPSLAVPAIVIAMGALNAVMTRVGPASVSLTYVTGTLVKFGQGVGRALCGRSAGWGWLLQGLMWLSLLAGAIAATMVRARLGTQVAWPLPGFAALMTLIVACVSIARSSAAKPQPATERNLS